MSIIYDPLLFILVSNMLLLIGVMRLEHRVRAIEADLAQRRLRQLPGYYSRDDD